MAVYAPTPPTPPTPPSPPRIVLGEGGTVRESTVPQSHGPKSGDEINEEAARSAVAHGSGTLSKTTVTKPEAKKAMQAPAAKEALTSKEESASSTKEADVSAGNGAAMSSATTAQSGGTFVDNASVDTQRQMALASKRAFAEQNVEESPFAENESTHGPVYWVFSIVTILILVAVAFRTLMNRSVPTASTVGGSEASPLRMSDFTGKVPPEPKPTEAQPKSKAEPPHFEVRV